MSWLSQALHGDPGAILNIALAPVTIPLTGGTDKNASNLLGIADNKPIADSSAIQPTDYEKELSRLQYEDALQARKDNATMRPILLESMGYKQNPDGTLTKIPQTQDELAKLYYDNALKAAKGELQVSPALEADLGKQQSELESTLARKLGPNWKLSTPGIQAMDQFTKNAGLLREEARRGMMTTGEGLLTSRMGFLTNQNQQNYQNMSNWQLPQYQGLSGLYTNAMQPFFANRQMQFQNDWNNQSINAQRKAGMMGLLGQGIGTLGTLAMMA